MNESLLPKKLIYECILLVKDQKWETAAEYLENQLETVAEAERWCPDWEYNVNSTDEEYVYEIKVYGEIEED